MSSWFYNFMASFGTPGTVSADNSTYNTSGKYTGSENATLWGKVKPVTYGNRRILGALLQIGPSSAEKIDVSTWLTPVSQGGYWVQRSSNDYRLIFKSTFAYCFGEPGNPLSRQQLKKIWIDKTLVYDASQGQLASNFRFYFYDGNEGQFPDAELNRDRYDYPVGYRGLMYIVFYDYTVNDETPTGNPVVEAEFSEILSNNQSVTNYDNMGSSLNTTFFRECGYDAKKNFLYQTGSNNQNIYKYDCTLQKLVDVYPITGAVYQGTFGSLGAATIIGSLRYNNTFYLLCTMASGNSRQLFMIEADTGVVVDDFGQNTSSLTPSLTNVCLPTTMHSVSTTDGVSLSSHFVVTDVFSNFYVFKFQNNQMTMIDFGDLVDVSGASQFSVIASEDNNIVVYSANNKVNTIDRWVNGTLTLAWYTGTYDIVHIISSDRDDTLIVFEADDIVFEDWRIVKIRKSDKSLVWAVNAADHPTAYPPRGFLNEWRTQSYTGGQKIAWIALGSNYIVTLDMISGQLTVVPYTNPNFDNPVYDAYSNQFIQRVNLSGSDATVRSVPVYQITSGNITLESLLRDLARRAGYENANVTVTGISDTITGAAITEITNIDTMLLDIATAYNFEVIKRGPKIAFIRRGYGDVFDPDMTSIEAERGILSSSDDEFITIRSERKATQKSAGTIRLTFIDPDYDYAVNEYKYSRNDDQSDTSVTLNLALPIIMTASQAATLATRVLINNNANRVEHEFMLPQKYLAIEKGDIVELISDEFTDFVRVNEIAYNADFSMSIRSETIVTSSASAVVVPDPVRPAEPPPLTSGDIEPLVIDTPLLNPDHQASAPRLETYVAVFPATRRLASTGSILKYFETAGPYPVGTTTAPAVYGRAAEELTGPVLQIDYDKTFSFRLVQGDGTEFETVTALEMLAGANRLLVGRTGGWELIGFISAAYNSDTRLVTVTGICRGLRGTDYTADLREVGDLVVLYDDTLASLLLDLNTVDRLDDVTVYVGMRITGEISTDDAIGIEEEGASRKPWRPYNVHAVAAGGDVGLTWHRRTRLLGPLLNGTPDVPLDEDAELYDLVLYRAGAIVRTVTGLTSPAFTYTAAMQSADGWSGAITSLQLDVYQISAVVGRGFPMSGTYDVE